MHNDIMVTAIQNSAEVSTILCSTSRVPIRDLLMENKTKWIIKNTKTGQNDNFAFLIKLISKTNTMIMFGQSTKIKILSNKMYFMVEKCCM